MPKITIKKKDKIYFFTLTNENTNLRIMRIIRMSTNPQIL